MSYTNEDQYWAWLNSIDGIGPIRFYRLIAVYKSAKAVWDNASDISPDIAGQAISNRIKLAKNEKRIFDIFHKVDTYNMSVVTRNSAKYPIALKHIYDPPPVLYVRGRANLNADKMIGIVGSRHSTRDGERTAKDFAGTLSRNGVTVVSGLAEGIDTFAHKGCVEMESPTVAVMASGADIIYPSFNDYLADEILSTGGSLVTEFTPGMPPVARNFPKRNRIISGMSKGVLIVEATKKSGAMITIRYALEQDRDVFAVPGSIYSPVSDSTNRLIQEGAYAALSGYDILMHYNWLDDIDMVKPERVMPDMSEEENKVYEAIGFDEKTVTEITIETGFPISKLNSLLTTMELRGIISKQTGNVFRVN